MAFNFLLKEDGSYLLQEDGVSKLIITEQPVPQKINLEVKRTLATSTDIEYTFRITSHDPDESIDLSNYRIVQYLNTRWEDNLTYGLGQTPVGFGGAGPGLSVFNAPDDIQFLTEDKPPHIYPEHDRFSTKRATRFNLGTLSISGAGYEGNWIRTHKGIQTWSKNLDTRYDYEPEHCYTSTTATDYEDNQTFVLEYNSNATKTDPLSPDWTLVTEYLTSATADPNTSVYPLGINGDNTKAVNRLFYPTKDNLISESFPTTVYNNDPLHTLHKGSGANERILEYYPANIAFEDQILALGTSAEAQTDVKAAEFWKWNTYSVLPTTLDINLLSADFNESTATWNTESENVSSFVEATTMIGTTTEDSIEFSRWKLTDTTLVKSWMMSATSAANQGIVTKYETESTPIVEGPYFATTESVLGNTTRPVMVMNVNFIGDAYTWTGAVDSNWSTPGNWQGNLTPDESNAVVFDGGVSVVPCILDTDPLIYSISATTGSGSIDFSTYNLTIKGGNADFTGFSSLTQDTGGSLTIDAKCYLNIASNPNNYMLKNLVITENAQVEYFTDYIFHVTESFNVSGTFFMLADITLNNATISFGDTAIIETDRSIYTAFHNITVIGSSFPGSGSVSAGVVYRAADNDIAARVYGGPVTLSNLGAPSSTISTTMTFDPGQHTFLDGLKIESYGGFDGQIIIDTSTNDPDILITNRGGLQAFSPGYPGEELVIIMGSKDWIIESGSLFIPQVDIFNYGDGGGFSLGVDVIDIQPPFSSITPPITLNPSTEAINLIDNLYAQEFTMNPGSLFNFNHRDISAVNSINISGNSESIILLSGSSIYAKNINFVGEPLDYIDLATEDFWFVSASDTLDAVHVDLKSSDASSGVTGVAVRSKDLGEP